MSISNLVIIIIHQKIACMNCTIIYVKPNIGSFVSIRVCFSYNCFSSSAVASIIVLCSFLHVSLRTIKVSEAILDGFVIISYTY